MRFAILVENDRIDEGFDGIEGGPHCLSDRCDSVKYTSQDHRGHWGRDNVNNQVDETKVTIDY